MKGISVWMFSKIVMLVFLVMTFSTVLGFLKLTNERVSADSAEALAMQIKDAIQTTLYTTTVSSETMIPIPKTLPEKGASIETEKLKQFVMTVNSTDADNGKIIYVAIRWSNENSYVAASSFLADSDIEITPEKGIEVVSGEHNYFRVTKTSGADAILCFRACVSYVGSSCAPIIGPDGRCLT